MQAKKVRLKVRGWGVGLALTVVATQAWAAPGTQQQQPQPPPTQKAPAVPAATDDAAGQALQDREAMRKAYEAINQYNPMSPTFVGAGATAPSGPLTDLQKVLSYPGVQTMLQVSNRLVRSPEVGRALGELVGSPHRMRLIYAQLVWLAIVFLFKSWRLSKLSVRHWTKIAALNLLSFFVYWGITLVVIPWGALGGAYPRLWIGVWRAVNGP